MKFYLIVNQRPEGPFEVSELLARPGFDGAALVCSVEDTSAAAWKRAETVPEFSQALAIRGLLDASVEAEPAPPVAPPPPPPTRKSAPPAAPAAANAAPAANASEPDAGPDPARKLIMTVEDNEFYRALLVTALEAEGFRVVAAVDGNDAIRHLESSTPDLIVTDLMMPGQGGFEFVRALQAAGHGDIPVIVVTGARLDPTTVASMRMEGNVVEILQKPPDMPNFFRLIHGRLGTKAPSPRLRRQKGQGDAWSSGI